MAFLQKILGFILAWSLVNSIRGERVLLLREPSGGKNKMLLIMTWDRKGDMTAKCDVMTDEALIKETLASNDSLIRTLPNDQMQSLLANCFEINNVGKHDTGNLPTTRKTPDETEYDYDDSSNTNRKRSDQRRGSRNEALNKQKQESKSNETATEITPSSTISLNKTTDDHERRKRETESTTQPSKVFGTDGLLIYPGTKWCGNGDISKNYDDLGYHKDTDRCCRIHDHCNDYIAAGETKHGLRNDSPFTKLSCRCDDDFYNCLQKVKSITANSVGHLYFNVLRRECYVFDYPPPAKTCKMHRKLLKLRCLKEDKSKEKAYQWVPAKI